MIPRGELLSLRWRLCSSQFGVLLRRALSLPPPLTAEDLGRKHPEADGDGDSLFSNAKLAGGAISSILRDSDLKRSGALPVEEALPLSLKGIASVSSCVFLCPPLSWF